MRKKWNAKEKLVLLQELKRDQAGLETTAKRETNKLEEEIKLAYELNSPIKTVVAWI